MRAVGKNRLNLVAFGSAAVAGAAMMVLEVLGTRYTGPFYGSSLYVWSAMIATTLGSLAVGYWLGGWVSARRPGPGPVVAAIAGAGVWVAVLPLLARPVLLLADGLGLRAGILASSALLFTVPLLLLGAVSPLAVQLLATPGQAGSAAGRVAAVTTVAGVLATLGTAMVLLPAFAIDPIAFGTAAGLLLWSATAALLVPRRWPAVVLVLAAGLSVFAMLRWQPGWRSSTARLVGAANGHVGLVRVLDTERYRFLLIDSGGQTVVERGSGRNDLRYVAAVADVTRLRPGLRRALLLGLGGGAVVAELGGRGVACDVVEIEPKVVELATAHFGFSPTGEVVVQDGRTYLAHCQRRYGAVILDVFGGGTSPAHLFTLEAVRATRAVLQGGGVLAVNYPYAQVAGDEIPRRLGATLSAVFPHVDLYKVGPPEITNLVYFASDAPLSALSTWPRAPLPSFAASDALTDSFNPLDRLQIAQGDAFRDWYANVLGVEALLP